MCFGMSLKISSSAAEYLALGAGGAAGAGAEHRLEAAATATATANDRHSLIEKPVRSCHASAQLGHEGAESGRNAEQIHRMHDWLRGVGIPPGTDFD